MTGKASTPELIEAVRCCAKLEMSAREAAEELSTPERPLSRNAIIGIAHRNAIKFTRKTRQGERKPQRQPRHKYVLPKAFKPHVQRTPSLSVPSAVAPKVAVVFLKKPGPRCSWADCTGDAQPEDMFCRTHGRKGLMT